MNLYLRLVTLWLRQGRRKRLGIWETARTPFWVVPTDLDLLGHMNNGKYASIMDVARMDMMMRCGYLKVLKSKGWYPVVAGQTLSYRRSLRPFQRFNVYTRILGQDQHGLYIEQTFCVGSTVYAQGLVRTRFLQRSGGVVSPDALADLVGGFPSDSYIPEPITRWAEMNRDTPRTFDSASNVG